MPEWERVPDDVRLQLLASLVSARDRAEALIWHTAYLLQNSGTPVVDLCAALDCAPATFYAKTKPYRHQD